MTKEDPKVYYAENENQPPATFSVVEAGDNTQPGDKIIAKPEDWLFEDDSSIGSQFFGLAIIHNALKAGKNLLLILNPSDKNEVDDR